MRLSCVLYYSQVKDEKKRYNRRRIWNHKRIDKKLEILELKYKEKAYKEIAEKTGYSSEQSSWYIFYFKRYDQSTRDL